MFASARLGSLDWTRLRDRSLPRRLKTGRQFGSSLFIGSHTCSHSGDHVLIRSPTWGDQASVVTHHLQRLFFFFNSLIGEVCQVGSLLEKFSGYGAKD